MGMGAAAGRDPTSRAGGRRGKPIVRNNGFCGHHKRRRSCFSLTAGVNFCFHHMCLYLKCSDFSGDFKYAKNMLTKFAPLCLPLLISSPALGTPETAGVMVPLCPLLGSLNAGSYIVCSFLPCCPLLGSLSASGYILRSFFPNGLPRFGVAPRVGVTDSHTLVWPLALG